VKRFVDYGRGTANSKRAVDTATDHRPSTICGPGPAEVVFAAIDLRSAHLVVRTAVGMEGLSYRQSRREDD
jgi:hypothetical protein